MQLCIAAFIRQVASKSGDKSSVEDKTPLEILKKRYAKGEINKEEFNEKKKDLL
ncbi:MAG: SHOCT domain-containing protein [Candidatus Staskawiczbacteria bacterium]|nr:SHOCT domain-containing protein [Candidatus Staskawiczbacteria bacterium]